MRRFIRVILLAVVLASCSNEASPAAVSEQEARDLLRAVAADVRDNGPEAACTHAATQANCRQLLADSGAPGVEPPSVACALRVMADGDRVRGVLLVTEGMDDTGSPYRSQFLAIGTEDGVRAQNPVYWSGVGVATAGAEVVPMTGGDCR